MKKRQKQSGKKDKAARVFRSHRQGESASETLRLLRAQGEQKRKTLEDHVHPE